MSACVCRNKFIFRRDVALTDSLTRSFTDWLTHSLTEYTVWYDKYHAACNHGTNNIVRAGEENPEQLAARSKRLGMSARGTFLICDIDVDNASEFYKTYWFNVMWCDAIDALECVVCEGWCILDCYLLDCAIMWRGAVAQHTSYPFPNSTLNPLISSFLPFLSFYTFHYFLKSTIGTALFYT